MIELRSYQYQTDAVAHLLDHPKTGEWVIQELHSKDWKNVIAPFKDEASCNELRFKIETVLENIDERGLEVWQTVLVMENLVHANFEDETAIDFVLALRLPGVIANLLLANVPSERIIGDIWDYGVP